MKSAESLLNLREQVLLKGAKAVRTATLGEVVVDLLARDGRISASSLRAELKARVAKGKTASLKARYEEPLSLVETALARSK